MRDQRTPAEREEDDDRAVLTMLVDNDNHRPWSVQEVTAEIGDALVVTDCLDRLSAGGLVHRLEGFVCATRAAVRAGRLA